MAKVDKIKVKARIIKNNCGYYIGEIFREEYDDKEFIHFRKDLKPGWNTITNPCITRFGCKQAIKKWKKDNFIEELEI